MRMADDKAQARPQPPSEPPTNGNWFQLPVIPRPVSGIDALDPTNDEGRYTDAFALGHRPLWAIPSVALSNEKVGTIKASAAVTSAAPALATQSGILSGPSTTLTTFTTVPNLGAVLKASGPVQITFALNAQTVNANDPASFAIFRDNVQVSQQYIASAGAANTAFSVTGS